MSANTEEPVEDEAEASIAEVVLVSSRLLLTIMPCRRTCRSHSRLFVKQRPQNSQGIRFSALLGPELLLLLLLMGDARTS